MICRENEVVMKHFNALSFVFIIILKCPNYGRSEGLTAWWHVVPDVHVKVLEPEYEPSKRRQLCTSRQRIDERYVPNADTVLSTDALNCLTQNNRRRRCWELRHLHQANCGPVGSTSVACLGRRGMRLFCIFLSNSLRFHSDTKFRQSCCKCCWINKAETWLEFRLGRTSNGPRLPPYKSLFPRCIWQSVHQIRRHNHRIFKNRKI